jgi:ABC-type multidrug transport system fused ATPase/permease subunit
LLKRIDDYRATTSLTVVIVAFRIYTFKKCDTIVVMKQNGSVDHTGTHDELMAGQESDYTKYCLLQQNAEET